jgi:hypothetical protein
MGHMDHKDEVRHNHDGKDGRSDARGGEAEKASAPAEERK